MTNFTQMKSTNAALPVMMLKTANIEEKDTETARKLKQDKELVQFASAPPSEYLGRWETHMTGRRTERIPDWRKKDMDTLGWALKEHVIAKLNNPVYLEHVQTMVSADKQWTVLMKDQRRRNEAIPQYFHDVVLFLSGIIGEAEKQCDYVLPRKLRDIVLEELYILFLIGFHTLANKEHGGYEA